MSNPVSVSTTLAYTASFRLYVDHYAEEVGLTQNKLATCTRINQPKFNKICNERTKDTSIPDLVNICLVLGLDREEACYLLSLKGRAFSPVSPVHQCYVALIQIYAHKKSNYRLVEEVEMSNILVEADDYLKVRGFPTLPNCNEDRQSKQQKKEKTF